MEENEKPVPTAEYMPLMGTFHHNVDSKNRLFIPAKHRSILGASFVIFPSIRDKSLKAFSRPEWEEYIKPTDDIDRKYLEKLNRFYNGQAITVTPDAQGRVVLTPELIAYAGLGAGNAVIIGCGHYSEIWSEENLRAEEESSDMAELIAVLEDRGL